MDRDFDANPYSCEEAKIVEYIDRATGGKVGGGDDPVEFLISLHANLTLERRSILNTARALFAETVEGWETALNPRFYMRLILLKHTLGLIPHDDLMGQIKVAEATKFFVREMETKQ